MGITRITKGGIESIRASIQRFEDSSKRSKDNLEARLNPNTLLRYGVRDSIVVVVQIHNNGSELDEKCSLQRFRQEISHHKLRGAVLHGQLLFSNAISDEVVSHRNVLGALSA